jgi:hypothetical protein
VYTYALDSEDLTNRTVVADLAEYEAAALRCPDAFEASEVRSLAFDLGEDPWSAKWTSIVEASAGI